MPNLTLSKCIDTKRAAEVTSQQLKTTTADTVHASETLLLSPKSYTHRPQPGAQKTKITNCKYCGQRHELQKEKCPVYGQRCKLRNKDNHFHIKCPEKKHTEKSHRPTKHKSVRTVDDYNYHYPESSTREEIIYISEEVLNVDSKLQKKLYATMEVDDNLVQFQIDSGATCNILPSKYTPSTVYDSESYHSTSHKLSMYNDSSLNAKGTCILKLTSSPLNF